MQYLRENFGPNGSCPQEPGAPESIKSRLYFHIKVKFFPLLRFPISKMAEPGDEISSYSEPFENKDKVTDIHDRMSVPPIESIPEPLNEKFIIRQQPARGKAIGFSQQFGNFM